MLDFLKDCGIDDTVIAKIEKENSRANIYNLSCNSSEAIKILEYLKRLNIDCIEELLIYRIELFFNSYDDMLERFSKYDINNLVKRINDDFITIDEIN